MILLIKNTFKSIKMSNPIEKWTKDKNKYLTEEKKHLKSFNFTY